MESIRHVHGDDHCLRVLSKHRRKRMRDSPRAAWCAYSHLQWGQATAYATPVCLQRADPAKRYHVSLLAMGRTPPPGFSSQSKNPSSSKASRGRSRDNIRLTSSMVTLRAASEDWQAAQIMSNVHPDRSAAVPR